MAPISSHRPYRCVLSWYITMVATFPLLFLICEWGEQKGQKMEFILVNVESEVQSIAS